MEPTNPNDPGPRKPRTRGFRSIPPAPGDPSPSGASRQPNGRGLRRSAMAAQFDGPSVPTPMQRPPLPKRPKGRFFVGGLLAALLLIGALSIWNVGFRYRAYGTISGRILHVPAPQGGNIRFLHVREGDQVTQGQLLVTIANVELEQKLARTYDDLLITQADLDAEISRLQWQHQQRQEEGTRAAAEYYQLLGDIAEEQRKMEDLELKLERITALQLRGAASQQEKEELRYALSGKRGKLEKLALAAAQRRKAVDNAVVDEGEMQLKPLWARIEALQIEVRRLREQIAQGEIRSPAAGRVVRNHFFTGEQVLPAQVVCEILESDSLEAVIYVPQQVAQQLTCGREIMLDLVPQRAQLTCTISRVGEQYISVPANLERYYLNNTLVLPVYCRAHFSDASGPRLRLGSEVRMPSAFTNWIAAWQDRAFAFFDRPASDDSQSVSNSISLLVDAESQHQRHQSRSGSPGL